jgi:hypothetical protein
MISCSARCIGEAFTHRRPMATASTTLEIIFAVFLQNSNKLSSPNTFIFQLKIAK